MADNIERSLTGAQQILMCCVLGLFLITIGGCTTGEKMPRLSLGMSQAEVVRILGKPDGFKPDGDHKVLKYTNKLISGWSADRADYFVILKDDQVTEYGAGEIRVKDVGGVYTVFIH